MNPEIVILLLIILALVLFVVYLFRVILFKLDVLEEINLKLGQILKKLK